MNDNAIAGGWDPRMEGRGKRDGKQEPMGEECEASTWFVFLITPITFMRVRGAGSGEAGRGDGVIGCRTGSSGLGLPIRYHLLCTSVHPPQRPSEGTLAKQIEHREIRSSRKQEIKLCVSA